ncbi:MAG: DUF1178 family protein [Aliishimia sp.]
MISFTLKCSEGHSFESWFQSAAAFESLKLAGHLSCAVCGSKSVEKAMMAPRVSAARDKAVAPPSAPEVPPPAKTSQTAMPEKMQAALQDMKRQVEENSDYVGPKFAEEARSMHLGDTPERPIYGEANGEETKALIEDGIPVMPLPFMPTKKVN